MKRTFALILAVVMAFGLMAGAALAYDPTPSTNDENRDRGWAHFNVVETRVGEVDVEFVSERSFWSCFEYRSDGEPSPWPDVDNFNTDIGDGLWPFTCVQNETVEETLVAEEYVEIRMVFGAERDERFDWTRIDVPPGPPSSLGEIQRDARLSEDVSIDGSRADWWVVSHEVDAATVDQIWWYENNQFFDVTQPQPDRPIVSDLWLPKEGRDAGNLRVFYKVNGEDGYEWVYLNVRFNGRGDLVQVNNVRP